MSAARPSGTTRGKARARRPAACARPAARAGGILGTGIDLVENGRMRALLERWGARLKDRVFRAAEQAYCEGKAFPAEHYAARFAVKEAVAKAFGTGVGPETAFRDIEVVRAGEWGPPDVRLHGRARALARRRGVQGVLVSLAHTREYAVAHAFLVGKETLE